MVYELEMTEIKINFAPLIGAPLALYMAYSMWSWTGFLFTLGLILLNATLSLTFTVGR